MNKYLEKIASVISLKNYIDITNTESKKMLEGINANLIEVDRNTTPDLYLRAMSTGGHGTYWDIKKDSSGNLVNTIDVLHTKPDWRVRLSSPIYPLFQSKENAELTSAIALRHEALEALETHNNLLPGVHKAIRDKSIMPTNVVIRDNKGEVMGEHTNLAVLMLESNLVNDSPYKDRLDKLFKLRNRYESGILKKLTGKGYGDYFNEEEISKGR